MLLYTSPSEIYVKFESGASGVLTRSLENTKAKNKLLTPQRLHFNPVFPKLAKLICSEAQVSDTGPYDLNVCLLVFFPSPSS